MAARVLPAVRRPFRAMAEAFVPEAEGLSAEQWARAEALVETSLTPRALAVKRQLQLFVRAANWLAVGRYGRPLTGLDRKRRSAFLGWLERAPILLVRRGVWGVRSLSFMAYYGLPEVREAIGYRARPEGWEARGGGHRAGGDETAGERAGADSTPEDAPAGEGAPGDRTTGERA